MVTHVVTRVFGAEEADVMIVWRQGIPSLLNEIRI